MLNVLRMLMYYVCLYLVMHDDFLRKYIEILQYKILENVSLHCVVCIVGSTVII